MADCKEKNLLNEIAYLTRLIGQHKGQIALNRKWDSNIDSKSSTMNYPNGKVNTHLIKSTRPIEISSYKCVRTVVKQRNSPYVKIAANHKKSNVDHRAQKLVYVNPRFTECSINNQQVNVDPTLRSHSVHSQISRVHINPNFCRETLGKTTKVLINSNFNQVANVESKPVSPVDSLLKSSSTTEQKLKVHVNPKFCKLLPTSSPHTQLRSLISNKVHVNPKLVETVLKEKNESGILGPKKSERTALAHQPSADSFNENVSQSNLIGGVKSSEQKVVNRLLSPQCNSRKSEFMSLGKRKLVRINQKPLKSENETRCKEKQKLNKNVISSPKQKRLAIISPSRSVKKSKTIKTKYKIVKGQSAVQITSAKTCLSTKYKIDRRSVAMKDTHQNFSLRNNYKDVSALRLKKLIKPPQRQRRFSISSSRTSNGNLVWRRTWSLQAKEFKTTNMKLYRIGSSPIVKRKDALSNAKRTTVHNSALVRIGGVLYKSSRNKLTRSHGPVNIGGKRADVTVALKKKGKVISKRQVLLIRGHKFVMDAQGKTLRRLSSSNPTIANKPSAAPSYSLRRVDIGGVTFVEKSSNVLMRTNTHKARSLLSYAKQKSIATLMKKLKKNNQPCIFFHKFGRCLRMEKGNCPCVHDRKHVAVCKRFLQAKCSVDGCLLSHDVVPEKMPTCRYFLEGCCNRADCPYLHVKVNAKADICTSFLQGYCSNGQKCKKRHVRICPDFEKKGRCLKGKKCPYPHVNGRAKRTHLKKRSPIQTSKLVPNDKKPLSLLKKANTLPKGKGELKRYYLAPEEAVGMSSEGGIGHEKQSLDKECKDNVNIPCNSEVSGTSGSVSVVNSRDVKLPTSQINPQREKIGSLPSFIPL